MRSKIAGVASAALFLSLATSAHAGVITLNFEGIDSYPGSSSVLVNDYYNGGMASNGATGPNYGVQFVGGGLVLCLNTPAALSCSNTSRGAPGPSDKGALFWLSDGPIMNVAAGFDTGFSFNYSDPFVPGGFVSVYDGLNGTGTLLATMALGLTPSTACDPSFSGGANYCPFIGTGLGFAGIGKSVVFGGTADFIVYDDITFGATTPGGAPEPAAWALMILGFGLAGSALRRRLVTA